MKIDNAMQYKINAVLYIIKDYELAITNFSLNVTQALYLAQEHIHEEENLIQDYHFKYINNIINYIIDL